MKRGNELAVLNKCRAELATIKDLPTLLEIRDKAKAIASYQKAREDGHTTSNIGKQIAALAEANAGRVIKQMQAEGTLDSGKGGDRKSEKSRSQDGTVISDLGISKNESARMQAASLVLDETPEWFDAYLTECNENGKDFTQQAVIRKGKELRNAKLDKTVKTPRGKYDVIVIDPPWDMQKIDRDCRPNQAAFDYPTMSEDELSAMVLPAAESCHLFCWTTHRFLPMALRLLPTWDFRYVCTLVWHKPGGFQPIGLPQYNCEFALYARKGSPKFADTKAFNTCFEAPRGEHSEKPEEFYELLRRVTGGKKLDMFNRRKIQGFTGWGNES